MSQYNGIEETRFMFSLIFICAERTALVKAVSEGHRKFKALAFVRDLDSTYISPCGACRQFMVQVGNGVTHAC